MQLASTNKINQDDFTEYCKTNKNVKVDLIIGVNFKLRLYQEVV